MPIPAGPIIAAGGELVNTATSGLFNIGAARRARKFSREMYARQRADSLADWNMENAYNSPAAQMARLEEAGLNPHLIYGQGGGVMQSGAVKASQAPGAQETPTPGIRLGDAMAQGYNIELQKAQLDNVKAQTEVAKTQAANNVIQGGKITAETLNTLTTTQHGKFDLARKEELKQVIFEKGVADLNMVKAQTDASVHGNIRAEEAFKLEQKARIKSLQGQDLDLARKKIDNSMEAMRTGMYEQMRPVQLAMAQKELELLSRQITKTIEDTKDTEVSKELKEMERDLGAGLRYIKEIVGGAGVLINPKEKTKYIIKDKNAIR